jgi:hypothetical protein
MTMSTHKRFTHLLLQFCACVPTVRPLFERIRRRVQSYLSRSNPGVNDANEVDKPHIVPKKSWLSRRRRRGELNTSELEITRADDLDCAELEKGEMFEIRDTS